MKWLDQHTEAHNRFPRLNWEAINSHVDSHHKECDQHELWCSIARAWMEKLKSTLSSDYAIHESDNFLVVTTESDRYVSLLTAFLERTLKRIVSTLDGIASDAGFGKYVVLIFDDIDDYYAYLSYFYSEDGVYGLSSGIYINDGYGHFAFPHQDVTYAEPIIAHEMTHALVAHLPIPAWLNEGMAVSIEDLLAGSAPLMMTEELYARHQAFWGEKEIQAFWSGEVFHRADEGQELSYHLARFAVNSLSGDFEAFKQFANLASYTDGGAAAAHEVYGEGVENLIIQFFGEGNWAPRPEAWDQSAADKRLRGSLYL